MVHHSIRTQELLYTTNGPSFSQNTRVTIYNKWSIIQSEHRVTIYNKWSIIQSEYRVTIYNKWSSIQSVHRVTIYNKWVNRKSQHARFQDSACGQFLMQTTIENCCFVVTAVYDCAFCVVVF